MQDTQPSAQQFQGLNVIQLQKPEDRQPMLMLTCGETGVGKTYRNILEIESYLRDNVLTGRKGRKVLIFDVNDDDYERYQTVSPDHIRDL